jgi:putative oxidoreductase
LGSTNSVEPAPYLPALRRIYEPLQPYGLTILRIALGVYLMLHGYPKVFEGLTAGLAAGPITKMGWPAPIVWAYIVAAVEFGGGLLIAVGFLTRLAAALALIEFIVIVLKLKLANGFFAMAAKAIQPGYPGIIPGGYELELLLGLLALTFVITGAGRLSIDRAIGREL